MTQQTDFQFIMIPQQLSSCLDANCHKMLSTLLGLHSICADKEGWFYRSNKDLQLDTRFSQNLVIATLDTLYQAGIIDVDCIGKGRGHRSNRIYVNFESFKVYQQYSFNEIRNNPDLWIETVPYKNHYSPSYCKEIGKEIGNALGKRIGKKVTTNTNTTDTIYTIDNINTIDNIYTKEIKKEENNNTVYNSNYLKEERKTFEESQQVSQKVNTYTKDIDYYFECFFNPACDYSSLVTNLDYFKNWYKEDLYTLKDKLQNKLNVDIPINEIVQKLQYEYTKEKP